MVMKRIIRNITFPLALLAVAAGFASCDTDVESVDINEPGIENQNSQLYQSYLENLRAYKQSDHKMALAWFDNSAKMPASQGQSIIAVPDSIDYLVLGDPADLNGRELYEANQIREQKGTKIAYEVSYTAIKNQYDADKQAFEENADNADKTFTSFNNYLVDSVSARLEAFDRFGYDAIVMTFSAKLKTYMSETEKQEELALENDFLGIAKDWKARHADKDLILCGNPQYVSDADVLSAAKLIVIDCTSTTDQGSAVYNLSKAAVDGVPTEKFVPMVNLYSADDTDTKTGYWGTQYAALDCARLVASENSGFKTAGLAMKNINADYYHANYTYPVVREAISIINPSVKK